MVRLFYGSNAYQMKAALDALVSHAKKQHGEHAVERVDGESVELNQLPDMLQGATLFAPERLVIIRGVSKNKPIWELLGEKLADVPASLQLVLVETAPDKRTKTFKALQKHAEVHEYKEPGEHEAADWLVSEAGKRGGEMKHTDADVLVARVGADQFRLSNELDKLLLYGDTGKPAIEALVEQTLRANVFGLLDAVMNGRTDTVRRLLAEAKPSEDPYMLFGMLGGQIMQLAALVHAGGRSSDDVAKVLKVHPYPLKKLSSVARNTSPERLREIVAVVAELDDQLKSTGVDPWLLLEQALLKIAAR